jgi:hypothetical protein
MSMERFHAFFQTILHRGQHVVTSSVYYPRASLRICSPSLGGAEFDRI